MRRGTPLALVAAVLAGTALFAQDPGPRFRSGVDLVGVTATVVDKEGHLITGLPRSAFEVFEDGEQQAITQFTNERVPVSLVLLLDVSDSMFGQRLVDARSAVERFLFELLKPEDEFAVLPFNHEPLALTNWTRDSDLVRRNLGELRASGATAMYDAVLTALPLMGGRHMERGAILVISDGADTASDATIRDVRSSLIRTDGFMYAIAIDPPARRAINEPVNTSALNEITALNGGRMEIVKDTTDLRDATARIAEELNSQYMLAYNSPRATDGSYHSIRVRLPGTDYLVRARRGYISTARR